jgi:hypothetical protein
MAAAALTTTFLGLINTTLTGTTVTPTLYSTVSLATTPAV